MALTAAQLTFEALRGVDTFERRIASPERGWVTMPEMPPASAPGTATESPVAAGQAALAAHEAGS